MFLQSWGNFPRHFELRSITPVATESACDITKFCSVNIDVWYCRISVACDIVE